MQKKKVTPPTIKPEPIKQLNMVSVKGLRMDIFPKVGYTDSPKININVDSIDGESDAINSFLTEVRTICKDLR